MNGLDYYNEHDPKCAAWLRELIVERILPAGDVDERSIEDVRPCDLRGYRHHHFFAGIGGWAYALRLAGWPDDKPVWTGSCPCQPFSAAGKRLGARDERHLWPAFAHLIRSYGEAPVIFGEQVASKDGRQWLAGVRADLEGMGYAVGGGDLCAAGVGAPHIRQRLYWVADANMSSEHKRTSGRKQPIRDERGSRVARLADTATARLQGEWSEYRPRGERCSGLAGLAMQVGVPQWNGETVAVECSDGPRRISAQPDAFPLAHGVQHRMVKLRGSGNAIVPQLAAEFIRAYLESRMSEAA